MNGSGAEGVIVIVEDDEGVAEFLEAVIKEFTGNRAVVVPNGETALSVIRQEMPRVVISDVMLPGMNGINVFDALQSSAETAGIPVIFISCCRDYWREIRQRGVKLFLEKPFTLDHLLLALDQAMTSGRPHAA